MIFMIAGGIVFLWFAAPWIAKGIFNIGNVTGMVCCGIVIWIGFYGQQAGAWLRKIWAEPEKRMILLMCCFLIGACLGIVILETISIVRAVNKKPPKNTTAVVLGCKVNGSKPSRVLQERLDTAYQYLCENMEAVCILSGGKGEDEDIAEAECMYRYLIGLGIAPKRLLVEPVSGNTDENLRYTWELMDRLGMEKEITIITSEFHAYRAAMTAEKCGFLHYSTASHTHWMYFPTYYVRELYGIVHYKVNK